MFAFIIFLLLVILLIARIIAIKSEKVKGFFLSLKKKLFFSTFIRYVLLSSLKSQIVFAGGISIGTIIPATVLHPEKGTGFIVFASLMIAIFNGSIALIAVALWRNRQNLNHEAVKSKIGALYELHDAQRPLVATYSVVFLARRSFFVMTTFVMYNYPGIQIEIMLCSTLGYLCYISQVRFHESLLQKRMELLNEWILVCLCYHFVIFADSSWERIIYDKVGLSTIIFVCILLGANMIIIMFANIKMIIFKCKVRMTDKLKIKLGKQKAEQEVIKAKIAVELAELAEKEKQEALDKAKEEAERKE